MPTYKITKTRPETYRITPLGAALVDALPDRKAVNKVKRDFRERGICPASSLFSPYQVNKWLESLKTTPMHTEQRSHQLPLIEECED